MLQNAYLLAKAGADTAENEQHFAEILQKIGNYPTGREPHRRGLRDAAAASAQVRRPAAPAVPRACVRLKQGRWQRCFQSTHTVAIMGGL